ncbi:MAG: hypothetical protein ACE37F_09165 [Nannocystaceae bacterium]|nr:hypothetical protein [bacterium]
MSVPQLASRVFAIAGVVGASVGLGASAEADEPASVVTLQRLVDGDVSFRFLGRGDYHGGGTSATTVELELRNVDGPMTISCDLERGIDKEMQVVEFFHGTGNTSSETGLSLVVSKEEFTFVVVPDQPGDYTYQFRSLSEKPDWDWIAPHECRVEAV